MPDIDQDDITNFARPKLGENQAELRCLMPYALLQMIDAFALAKGISRAEYCTSLVEKHVRLKCHERSIEQRMTRDNQYAVMPMIVNHKPSDSDPLAQRGTAAWKTLPADAISLMDVTRNTAGTKRAIRKADQFALDCVNRDWQSATGVAVFTNFVYDPREPRVFYLYPPATGGTGSVDVVYSTYPVDVPTPSGALYTTCTGNLSVVDQWDGALLNYVLYRAYAKDAEFGGNQALSDSYMAAFIGLIGGQLQSSQTVAPKQ